MKRLLPWLAAAAALAQSPPAPPQVLRITRLAIKPGGAAEHEKTAAAIARAMGRANYPAHFLALSSMTGETETWILESHDSFASVENAAAFADKIPAIKWWLGQYESQTATPVSQARRLLAIYRPDLSYRGEQLAQDLPKMRFVSLVLVRLHPARDMEFAEAVRTVRGAYEKIGSEQPLVIYQVVSGAPGPAYLFLSPMVSLKTMDEAPQRGRAMREAMGEDKAAEILKTSAQVTAASESFLLALNPRLSYVSKEFAAGDPDFWTPKLPPRPTTPPAAPSATPAPGAAPKQ